MKKHFSRHFHWPLRKYGAIMFWRISSDRPEVLLCYRAHWIHPCPDSWCEPGGRVEQHVYQDKYDRWKKHPADASFLEGAKREACEETSLPKDFFEREKARISLDPRPFLTIVIPLIYIGKIYACRVEDGFSPFACDRKAGENSVVQWFPLDALPPRKKMAYWLPLEIRRIRRYIAGKTEEKE